MLKKKKPVLDERELQEMYRIEHLGLWLMIGLLCAAVLVQLLLGAGIVQMAGELAAILVVSVVMIISNVRHGIWDTDSRPSVRGNVGYALACGVCVAAVFAAVKGRIALALMMGAFACALCFALLSVMMAIVARRQSREEAAFVGEDEDEIDS